MVELKMQKGEFHYTEEGISTTVGYMKFTKPANPSHVSMRAGVHEGLGETVVLQVRTLRNFMKQNNHKHLDILKLDIEGSEYDVLTDLVMQNFLPFTQLLVEFHQRFEGVPIQKHRNTIASILKCGFEVVENKNEQEFSFLRRKQTC